MSNRQFVPIMYWWFFFICLLASPALGDKRVALVIGNSAYEHAAVLANPNNDATDISASLERLGYDVITASDLKKADLENAIRTFSRRLEGADLGLFFYAGHGLQVAGTNYLVPVDAKLATSDSLDFELIRLEVVQRIMENGSKTNIIFLDACRNNPLARNLARALGTRSSGIRQGLAPAEAGAGTLISFSTQPGNVALDGSGRNSPFTSALLLQLHENNNHLSRLLVDVRRSVMSATSNQQIPWEHSALTSLVYLGMQQTGITKPAPSHLMTCGELENKMLTILRGKNYTRDQFEATTVEFGRATDSIRSECEIKKSLFIGPVLKIVKCVNNGTYVELGGDKGGAYMIIENSQNSQILQGGAPAKKGQWVAGLAGAPYYCLASTAPNIVWAAKIAKVVGAR
jgi:Caspase domain